MAQISKEYAVSLFSLAVENSSEEKYLDELKLIAGVFEEDADYYELLASPSLTREERTSAIDEAFGPYLSEYVLSFLKILCTSGHIRFFPDCVEEYSKMYRESKRTADVKVTSAVELTDDEKERIVAKVRKLVGGDCEIRYSVDPSLIGGAVIETENAVIDGSLRKSLQEMKEVIKK